jgi:hypothetical protein
MITTMKKEKGKGPVVARQKAFHITSICREVFFSSG